MDDARGEVLENTLRYSGRHWTCGKAKIVRNSQLPFQSNQMFTDALLRKIR